MQACHALLNLQSALAEWCAQQPCMALRGVAMGASQGGSQDEVGLLGELQQLMDLLPRRCRAVASEFIGMFLQLVYIYVQDVVCSGNCGRFSPIKPRLNILLACYDAHTMIFLLVSFIATFRNFMDAVSFLEPWVAVLSLVRFLIWLTYLDLYAFAIHV